MKAFPILLLVIIYAALIIAAMRSRRSDYNSNQSFHGNRMLTKSQTNRVFAGVCGGIAEHFGWNATIVRLFFILSGVGLLTYVFLAFVIPDSPSPLL